MSTQDAPPGASRCDVVVGIQWGDEGKGRVVDLYAADYDIIARFGGGDNAGHSIRVGDTAIALRIVPSGVLNEHVDLFVGGGTVVNPATLLGELEALARIGVDITRVSISDRAQMVLPFHAALDRASEKSRGDSAIGTTGRGIGPAYADRVMRSGIAFGELRDMAAFDRHLREIFAQRRSVLEVNDAELAQMRSELLEYAARLAPHVVDGVAYIHEGLALGRRILAEGAQGTLLDIGYGTYPYVTSSHTLAGGACVGLGVGPTVIENVTGVAKAYCTRVGAGPFPSELTDARGEYLRKAGAEFGTVTGRPRRCGWFDAVAGRYAAQLNGLQGVILTKLDVLSGMEHLALVTGYRTSSGAVSFGAFSAPDLSLEIEELAGWKEPLGEARVLDDLPAAARRYVERIESLLRVPVVAISVGPERSQYIKTCG